MFAQQIFQDCKENVKSSLPTKMTTSNSRKGLKSYSLNSFKDSTNVLKKKNDYPEKNSCKLPVEEKENSKPKVEVQKLVNHDADDPWSDIEEMHICIEPDDDYEDILPKCDRIQKADIDSLFLDYCSVKYTEIIPDGPPSPLKEDNDLSVLDLPPPFPEIKWQSIEAALSDDSELYFIPEPSELIA